MVFRSSHQDSESSKGSGYRRFFAMIGTLAVVMYGLKCLNT